MRSTTGSTGGVPWLAPLLVLAAACAHVPERTALPEVGAEEATVLGIARARMWGDDTPPWAHDWLEWSKAETKARYSGVYGKKHTYLAISGGGENGAFAAGLLLGWTERGDRPEFTSVTGVSAGALQSVIPHERFALPARELYRHLEPRVEVVGTCRALASGRILITSPLGTAEKPWTCNTERNTS